MRVDVRQQYLHTVTVQIALPFAFLVRSRAMFEDRPDRRFVGRVYPILLGLVLGKDDTWFEIKSPFSEIRVPTLRLEASLPLDADEKRANLHPTGELAREMCAY